MRQKVWAVVVFAATGLAIAAVVHGLAAGTLTINIVQSLAIVGIMIFIGMEFPIFLAAPTGGPKIGEQLALLLGILLMVSSVPILIVYWSLGSAAALLPPGLIEILL
jgi:hypothetical protein